MPPDMTFVQFLELHWEEIHRLIAVALACWLMRALVGGR